jgi:hypothetical protein
MARIILRDYLRELEETGNCLMIYADEELIFKSKSKGIRPHLEAIDELGDKLHGSLMVDKIVGRAAALLILYSKASKVQAQVLSEPGKQIFDECKIDYYYVDLVPHIKLEDGRIFCPFERMVQGISDPKEAYYAIIEKMAILSSS